MRISILVVVLCLIAVPAMHCPAYGTPPRGIAVLASDIGHEYTPEALAEFVQQGKFSPVVVDWAWITYHWGQTDFAAVNKFLDLMAAQKVPVAAMYRPRFLSDPTVPTQMGQDGMRGTGRAEICYSDASARKWGLSWGEKILDRCPGFREIIIYHPTNTCQCPDCRAAAKDNPDSLIVHFLAGARTAWKAKQPGVKLGVVSMTDPGFWKAGLDAIDIAHPYLLIREGVDHATDVKGILAVRSIVKDKMGACLGKITWEPDDKVSAEKLRMVDELARKNDLPYFFWTFDTLFDPSLYDTKAVAEMVGIDLSAIEKLTGSRSVQENVPSVKPTEAQVRSAEALISQISTASRGQAKFDAIDAVVKRIRQSDAVDRSAILSAVAAATRDKARDPNDRWPLCYVISRSGYEQGVPDLIDILQNNELEMMRAVAVEALADFPNNTSAHDALLQAARTDTAQMVREVLNRRLGKDIPMPGSSETRPVKDLAPSGPPKPPAGPAKPVEKPLPWPFPGDSKAQKIFNNYQTSVDEYIHCGLDFILPVGTPVTAVSSGYVSAIWSYPPHTADFFIVTPEKGGSTGWCYTHMDPQTFTFKEGDYVEQGQRLGSLVEFDGKERTMDHLHLSYVRFTRDAYGNASPHSLLDPLLFFDWKDTVPPSIKPLYFVSDGTSRQFDADASGAVTVSGKVDVLAAITDSAYPGQESFLGVPLVMLSISDGTHTMQKLVLDHRGDAGNEKQTGPLYMPREEGRKLIGAKGYFPYYQVLHVTRSDGDGRIEPEDGREYWDTTASGEDGKPLWPNGTYSVNVYAWDIAGNRGAAGAIVQVKN